MLIKQKILAGIKDGSLDLAFRRWQKARVKPGTRLRTAVGVLEVVSVDVVPMTRITAREAKRAGHTKEELQELLGSRSGPIHRIRLRAAGEDPRIALRSKGSLSADEFDEVRLRLDRMDKRARNGPWTRQVLRLIKERPGVRAGDLAPEVSRERRAFKTDVRKLKELGLTESLEVGYRLSPRGRTVLRRLG